MMNKVSKKGWLIFLTVVIASAIGKLVSEEYSQNSHMFEALAHLIWFIVFVAINNKLTTGRKVALYFISIILFMFLSAAVRVTIGLFLCGFMESFFG